MINVCIRGRLQARYSLGVWRGQADYWSNIHSVYEWFRRITDLIVIWYARVRWLTDWIFIRCMEGSGGLPTRYSLGVWISQADYLSDIQWRYEWVRRITDWIFSDCMQGSGGWPTRYSFGVWTGQADYPPNIQWLYAGVRRMTKY